MADVVISEFMDEAAVEELRRDYDVAYDPGLAERRDDLARLLAEARALIVRNRTRVERELLETGPNLRVVARLGVGLDNIDVDACRARDVEVCATPGANASTVAEYVIASLLILFRGAFDASARVVAGEWPREELVGREIAGKQLGLAGYGATGREVAARAVALGMRVAAYDPFVPPDDPALREVGLLPFDDLLRSSEALSVHVPLTADTESLIDAAALERLPPGAVLVNTSRGGVVDEGAVVAALREGRLTGAALDVFEEEPLPKEGGSRFAGVPNLLLTPHIAGITAESNERVSRATAQNVRRVLEGE